MDRTSEAVAASQLCFLSIKSQSMTLRYVRIIKTISFIKAFEKF